MIFNSTLFLFIFAPAFFAAYFLFAARFKKYIVILGSLLFYAWGVPVFIFYLLVFVIIDWYIGGLIYCYSDSLKIKRLCLVLSLIINIGTLIYFKYLNFFIENANLLLANHFKAIPLTSIILPVGISFIIFHKTSYIMDIYQVASKPADGLGSYILYIFFFPKILAGPIVRYRDFANQPVFTKPDFDCVLEGINRFSLGLAKKVLIADSLGWVADAVFKLPLSSLPVSYAWLGAICYTFQIYFDFSGYSDMAIGLGRIMGFNIVENFNKPYISQSFTEFWRRWHISLSNWLRTYLYIPLGGNRCSKLKNYFNLWLVFLVSGLWHGANWTFVVWGIYHGFFLTIDKIIWLKQAKKTPVWINTLLTFILIVIGWVLFRSENLSSAVQYIIRMFDFSGIGVIDPGRVLLISNSQLFFIIVAVVISFAPLLKIKPDILAGINKFFDKMPVKMLFSIFFLLLSMMKVVSANYNPFIYFKF
jgi:alginate O-acetyltransferase complex protein AlgI